MKSTHAEWWRLGKPTPRSVTRSVSRTTPVDRHLVWNYVFHFQDLGLGRPSGPEWLAIVRAYRTTKAVRPSEEEVAEEMGISERTLALKLRSVKIERWDDVHAWGGDGGLAQPLRLSADFCRLA
jgi:hypothetical protein